MEWAIFGACFVFIIILLGVFADSTRQKRKLATQEMLQRERLMAIEKGLPIPDWDPALLNEEARISSNPEINQARKDWFRFINLWLGVVLVFSGIGMGVGFGWNSEVSFRELASLGAIPLMLGIGLLLFAFLTREPSGH